MKKVNTMKSPLMVSACAITLFFSFSPFQETRAADATWNVDDSGSWATDSNWDPASAPGSTSSTDSTDIATFSLTITGTRTITVDANRNIGGITFNHTSDLGSSTTAYAINQNFLLSSGGVIQSISASGAKIERINNSVIIQGDGGTATFSNTSSSTRMIFNDVRGVSTLGNTTTLTLDGTSTTANMISSTIADGVGGGKLAIVKNGSGTWRMGTTSNNTYSGGTTLNAGTLQFVNATGNPFGTGAITVNGGRLQNGIDGTVTIINDIDVGGDFDIAGRTASTVTFSGDMNLGGANRTITAAGPVDSNVTLSGVISNGAFTKGGNAEFTLAGANTYEGNTTVNAGKLTLAETGELLFVIGANGVNNKIAGIGAVDLNGTFKFNLSGADTTSGNSWTIVEAGTLTETYGGTFAVDGFTDQGSGLWSMTSGSNVWEFSESSGVLSVIPEPSASLALGLGVLLLVLYRRRQS